MTDETNIPTEVQQPAIVVGKLRFGTDQFNNPAPSGWLRISKGLKYFCSGMVVMVSGTSFLTSKQSNIVNFCLGLCVLILGSVDAMLGVSPATTNQ